MEILESTLRLLQSSPLWLFSLTTILGLLVGSFLNVVIYRLPIILERDWKQQCAELNGQSIDDNTQTYNLVVPRSRCRNCQQLIKAWQNIPILSYLLLKGRCPNCGTKISLQYPLVESLTAVISIWAVIEFGFSWKTGAALLFSWSLIALSIIDLQKTLLPDNITLPFLWLGLLINTTGLFAKPVDAIVGAAAGYLTLWSVYWIFKKITGKEGMGYGDFKLLAMLGAWFGWQALPLLILLSSAAGAVIGISLILFAGHKRQIPIPFGPYLAIAGWVYLLFSGKLHAFWPIP